METRLLKTQEVPFLVSPFTQDVRRRSRHDRRRATRSLNPSRHSRKQVRRKQALSQLRQLARLILCRSPEPRVDLPPTQNLPLSSRKLSAACQRAALHPPDSNPPAFAFTSLSPPSSPRWAWRWHKQSSCFSLLFSDLSFTLSKPQSWSLFSEMCNLLQVNTNVTMSLRHAYSQQSFTTSFQMAAAT